MLSIKLIAALSVLLVTILSAVYPFIKKERSDVTYEFPLGEAFSAGVFLGAGLLHMLADAANQLYQQGYSYPLPFLLAGVVFLILLLFEHIGMEIYKHNRTGSMSVAMLITLMLSIHALLAGVALGVSQSLSVMLTILAAILAHKWAESFALAIELNKTSLAMGRRLWIFSFFVLMTPLGIAMGQVVSQQLDDHTLLEPIFSALASGTFLYLGTLHSLKRAARHEPCCNLNYFMAVIAGFAVMAVVAIWT